MQREVWFPALVMLCTGAANTLLMKFLVLQAASPGPGLPQKHFDFPFFQTMLMMIGELMCLGAFFLFHREKATKAAPPWIMSIPVSCDWCATTLVNAAYVLIPASTIQMCRGCIVVFTCFLSVTVLKKRQEPFHYAGVALVAAGITIVSLSAALYGVSSAHAQESRFLGISLCIAAQVFQSSMLVVEEKFLHSYTVPPLQMVGLEGLFGCIIGMVILTSLQVSGVESSVEAMYMVKSDRWLQFGCVFSMISIAFFNWSGVTVTQKASAVARATIDVSRTCIIWVVELLLMWNTFSWLQFIGFVVLVCGTLLYNGVLRIAALERAVDDETKPLVPEA